ncbi:hypothetical protein NP493_777g01000 [Ridgeia piscesae]|uniref:Cytochrome b-c1 complex subunit 8 n=1 Tax=Ridgeia piscesae TaxID=27915 RepID=A0AAD9KQ49_RIDPI|nr:hypothetical protein NP493_777g01000 [Ridgeia piscesae]
MARHFGSLGCKVRGIISYTLSPYELKAYAGAFSKGVPNMMFRIQSQIFRVIPPILVGYLIYDWGETYHEQSLRKNPKDFENDQ